MEKICKIAQEHNLLVIEDACHALGANYQDSRGNWHKVGSCTHSDMTVFSFHPVKHITTGEGGMILTNNEEFYERLLLFRSHGITKNPEKFTTNAPGPWYYEMQELGYNYRVTDFQCALGIEQLKKLDKFIEKRREIVQKYNQAFKDVDEIITPYEKENAKSSWHIYVIQLRLKKLNVSRKEIFEDLRKQGIGCQVHYIPVHLQPYYQKRLGYKKGDFHQAEKYYEQAITLPLFPKMSDEMVLEVSNKVKQIVGKYSK